MGFPEKRIQRKAGDRPAKTAKKAQIAGIPYTFGLEYFEKND